MKSKHYLARTIALSFCFAAIAAAQVTISPATLPNGMVGTAYQQDVTTGINNEFNWTLFSGSLPPGLTLTNFSPPSNTGQVGRIAGTPTTAGTFNFIVQAQVPGGGQTLSGSKAYTLVIDAGAVSPLTVVPTSITLNGVAGGDRVFSTPLVVTTPTAGEVYTPFADDGNNGAVPSWFSVNPPVNTSVHRTPASIIVSGNPATLSAGTFTARLVLINSAGRTVSVPVTFNVKAGVPQVSVAPTSLRFASRIVAPGILEQPLVITNPGGGIPISIQATIVNSSPWLSITPSSGQTAPNTPVLVKARVVTTGLPVGAYSDIIRIASVAGSFDVRVTLFVQRDGPILTLSKTGVRLNIRRGNGNGNTQTVLVHNTGSPNTTITWTTTQRSASNFLAFTPAGGTATPTTHGTINLSLNANAQTLPAGGYYTLVSVIDPNAINSPQVFVAVLDVADPAAVPPQPEFSTAGLTFSAALNGATPTAQAVDFNTSSNTAVPFQARANTTDGASWLTLSPTSGTVSSTSKATLVAGLDLTKLTAAGVYTAKIDVSINGTLRSVAVTLTLLPAGATPSAKPESGETVRSATGCTPTRAVITPLGIPGGFSIPASWPTTLAAAFTDDCGTVLPGGSGSIVASFDSGDTPLTLNDLQQDGIYIATWTPTFPAANMAVTLRGSSGQLTPATTQIIGGINANTFAPPVLFDNGTVNNTNPLAGALLAPGAVTAAYGQNLASTTVSPGVIPLADTFNGTTILMGGLSAPFYFLSSGQLNVQTPFELAANQQVAVAAQVNNAYAVLPNGITLVASAPGVSSFADTHIIAQHADFTLVDASKPSKAGESIVTYVSGMGATTPSVASGVQTPNQLVPAKMAVTVTVNGVPATVLYAGLTPGGIGLDQINFTVPPSTAPGDATVVITQNGIVANVTKLPVGAP